MEFIQERFTEEIFDYVEQIKELISSRIWQNILLDCSKNELLILWLLYRRGEANMTQIADYIQVPLNTATGIIDRMEKRELVIRERSEADKRVVTIRMGEVGKSQMHSIMKELIYYGRQVMEEFTPDEFKLLSRMMNKITEVMKEEHKKDTEKKTVRKIVIE